MTKALVKHTSASLQAAARTAHDEKLAEQLTAQYEKAISGLVEQVKCGAMLLQREEELGAGRYGNRGNAGEGLKGWIEAHCPKVHYKTAMRFKECAEAVKAELQIGDRTDMARLLNSAADALSPKENRVRTHIEDFLAGKSQRQLLWSFRVGADSDKKRGGHPELNAFIKEFYPEMSGQRLAVADLSAEMRAEFEQWKAEQDKKRPSGIAWQRQRATESWQEVERVVLDALARNNFGLMEYADRKRVDELFARARKDFAEAMK